MKHLTLSPQYGRLSILPWYSPLASGPTLSATSTTRLRAATTDRVADTALELVLEAWYNRPFEVVQGTGGVQKNMAALLELSGFFARLALA